LTSFLNTVVGWTQTALGSRGPSLLARILLLPGLLVRQGASIISARLLRVNLVMAHGDGIEPEGTYPGLSAGPRRAIAITIPYVVTLALGLLLVAAHGFESRVLSAPIYGGSPAFLDGLRGEEWYVLFFFLGLDIFAGRGSLSLFALWVGAASLGVSGPRWRDIDKLREDVAAVVSGWPQKVIDGTLLVPRWCCRGLSSLHLEVPVGGLIVIALVISHLPDTLNILRPFR
jgi:hypothetical protein